MCGRPQPARFTKLERPSGHDQQGTLRCEREGCVDAPEDVAIAPAQGRDRDDPEADLVRDDDRQAWTPDRHSGDGLPLRLDRDVAPPLGDQVGDPEREAVDDSGLVRLECGERRPQLERLLDGRPGGGPLRPVQADTLLHLRVAGSCRGDERRDVSSEPHGQGRFSAPGTAEQRDEAHRRTGITAPSTIRTRAP